jgi:hypothetical protein
MSKPMTMSELIAFVGDENVEFQMLDNSTSNLAHEPTKNRTRMTVYTAARLDIVSGAFEKLGILMWLDRDKVAASLNDRDFTTQAMTDVLAERRRQRSEEGWTSEHDDAHADGEIGRAAAAYALTAMKRHQIPSDLARAIPNIAAAIWPWDRVWWKPKGVRRTLVKAAALLIAEIERLDRKAGGA